MIFTAGILVCLTALIVIGLSGNARRLRRPWILWAGLALMLGGAIIAVFATPLMESMGWMHPGD